MVCQHCLVHPWTWVCQSPGSSWTSPLVCWGEEQWIWSVWKNDENNLPKYVFKPWHCICIHGRCLQIGHQSYKRHIIVENISQKIIVSVYDWLKPVSRISSSLFHTVSTLSPPVTLYNQIFNSDNQEDCHSSLAFSRRVLFMFVITNTTTYDYHKWLNAMLRSSSEGSPKLKITLIKNVSWI